jgi:prepilin-type processing-associated H-X9-DG protein
MNNLKQLFGCSLEYAEEHDGVFPHQTPTDAIPTPASHDSLNVLLKSPLAAGLDSRVFVCPVSDATPASADENGRFTLAAENLGYAWSSIPRSARKMNVLACCDHKGKEATGHDGVINVLYTDGSVHAKTLEEFAEENKDFLS